MTTKDLIKNVSKSGMKWSKEKLLETIRKSPEKEFLISEPENKKMVVVIST